jgi:hypothetical protein
MKKALFLIGYFAFIALFVSCGDQTSKSDTNSQTTTEKTLSNNSTVKSPVGTYSAVENGNPMQFILKDDGTGYENYKGTENRPFTWKSKDGKTFFIYDGEAQEWELPVDVEKGEIIYGSLVYKKE